jgi:hypothetical protein
MIPKNESRQSFQVDEPKTGKCKKRQGGSVTSLEENRACNHVVNLKQTKCSVDDLTVPENELRSARRLFKASSG